MQTKGEPSITCSAILRSWQKITYLPLDTQQWVQHAPLPLDCFDFESPPLNSRGIIIPLPSNQQQQELQQNRWRNFQLSVESKPLHYITSQCDWSTKLTPPSQPIRLKSNTNRALVARVFPRFERFAGCNFEPRSDVFLCSDNSTLHFTTVNRDALESFKPSSQRHSE